MRRLNGRLTRVASYQGTIADVGARPGLLEYLTRKIYGLGSEAGEKSRAAIVNLETVLQTAIRSLSARDFEIFVDLITREAGWKRLDELGGTQRGIDMLLSEPLTGQTMIVSVKATIGRGDLDAHLESLRDAYPAAAHRVLAIHRPPRSVSLPPEWSLWDVETLAAKAVQLGLADWVAERAL